MQKILSIMILIFSSSSFAETQCTDYENFETANIGEECIVNDDQGSLIGHYKRVQVNLINNDSLDEKLVQGVKDMLPNGMIWLQELSHSVIDNPKQQNLQSYCNAWGADLPTGYPESFNGWRDLYPEFDSDFVLGKKRGLDLALDMSPSYDKKAYWSSSLHTSALLSSSNNRREVFYYDLKRKEIDRTSSKRFDSKMISRCVISE